MESWHVMTHPRPSAQIHCPFSTLERRDAFPDALREKICMYLIGIGHNQSLPILCARATDHYVHLLIAVPGDVALAQAMLLLKGEFLRLAAPTPIRFHLTGRFGSLHPSAPKFGAVRPYIDHPCEYCAEYAGVDPQSAWQS